MYEETRARHLELAFGRVQAAVARIDLPAESLQEERTFRLRALLRTTVARSRWHRRRLDGLVGEAPTEADLRSVPPMTKSDLMENFDEIVTDPRLSLAAAEDHLASLEGDAYLLEEFHVVASGGSSGEPGVFVWGWEGWADAYAAFVRYNVRDLFRDAALQEMPPTIGVVAAEHATHMTSALTRTFSNEMLRAERFPVTRPLAEIRDGLNAFRPTALMSYASMLGTLAQEALDGRLRIAPLRVISTSEPLDEHVRDAVHQAWGAPIANWWGTSEFGATGIGCYAGVGMHLSDDLLIYEFVDEQGNPVATGQPAAKVYVTNLYNDAMPLIRYELPDEVVLLDDECPCGSGHRRVADIRGRMDQVFTYRDGTAVHPHLFRSVLTNHMRAAEYRVLQTPRGATVEVCGGEPRHPDLREELASALKRAGVADPVVEVRRVHAIERLPSGKVRRFVPLPDAAG